MSQQIRSASGAALAEADALVAGGRPLDAVAALTAANRRGRDPEVERRLVTLRHEAAATIERVDPSTLPAPVVRAPGEPGPLPSASPGELSVERLRAGLAEHGCLLVRGLVAPDRARDLAAGIDAALDAFDAGDDEPDPDGWYAHFTPEPGDYRVGGRRRWVRATGAVWTADSPRMLFQLLEVVDETGVGDLVTEYLGERPALSANKCTLRRVPVDTNAGWHQDGAFLGEEVRTLNMWLALGPCGVDAPGLDVVPRRFDQVLPTGGEGAYFDWDVSPATVAEAAGATPVLRPEFAAGDVLLFDHLFLHRTAVGPHMTRERHAIETWFFSPSAYPKGQIPVAY